MKNIILLVLSRSLWEEEFNYFINVMWKEVQEALAIVHMKVDGASIRIIMIEIIRGENSEHILKQKLAGC